MKTLALAATLALLAGAAAAQSPVGLWKTEPGETGAYLHVTITPCGDALCGVISEAIGATRTDLVGKPIISGMKPDGTDRWSGGNIWAPDTDKTYRSKMALSGRSLEVEGCVAIICRGQTWTRLD
jgi:uncharacterized protein (DUF2147 family)